MPNPVVHFEVIGKDGKKLQDFYRNVFGWTINADNPMNYGIVEAGDHGIGGGIGPSDDGGSGHVTFYIGVDDPRAYLDKVVAAGGSVLMPVTEIPGAATIALFADPEGHMIGVLKDEPHNHPHPH